MSSDYQLEDTIYLPFTTRAFATGIPTALVGGVIDIYEDVTATPIITAETLTVSLNGHAGFNMITVTATSASGFEAGKSYTAILDAGTVGGVSVIGEVVAHFTLDKSAAAKDLANATDGLGAIKTTANAIETDTQDIQGRLPAALVNSRMDSTVDASGFEQGAIDNIWDEDATGHQTQGTFGQAIGDPAADATTIYQAVVTDAAGDNVSVDVVAVKAETALIVADTDDIQTRLPAALVGGRMDSDVAVIQANAVSASALATDAVAEIADGVWDEDIVAAHNTADTSGAILNNILPEKNAAFNNIEFLWVAASDHVTPVTGATTTSVTRSIDGGAFGAGTGTLAEVGNGIYQYDASAADMNGTIITFRFAATGGTPGAPDDAFVTLKTSG